MLDAASGTGEWSEESTAGWGALDWGRELVRRDVGLLFCAGIDRFLWGALKGNGIDVIPDAVGEPEEVLSLWQGGAFNLSGEWPHHTRGGCRRERLRGRFRCRRGRKI